MEREPGSEQSARSARFERALGVALLVAGAGLALGVALWLAWLL